MYTTTSKSCIMAYVSSPLITSNFSVIPSFTYFSLGLHAVGEVDLCFSLMLVRKANNVEQETIQPCDYTNNVINPNI